ncbi:HNH endonuclease signature motif containing protein [Knoellia koreensis]|uniref:HNH endonuclease n=1 Tax=Knoellia koreensis TaxID=2730921 RepID=A0A849HF12_9MICO|nr:HNH endonuclease signature motif containing protein [Knoellia sp. DB2414S]NNM45719.1 HNH endonuclease [Knoellia sp. DB2414S]
MIDIVGLLRTVSADAARLADAPRRESIDDFVQLVGDTQRLVSMVQAVQTVAIANVSAIEDVVDPGTGEVVEQFRGYGHHRMDAAALVSDELGVTARGAETRVGVAAQLAGRYPCVLEAMGQGRIDPYRASIIEHELADAPDDAVEAVLAKIEPHLGKETGGRLRQRVRRVLGQVAAEFLRQKAAQARKERSLQRWPGDGPGVDTWVASLPVEQSQKAWSAIDTLAREYVRAGHNTCIEQARADAMLAFIDGNTRAEYVIQVAVPESRLNGALANVTETQTSPHATGQPATAARMTGAATERFVEAAAAPAENAADLVETADLDAWVRQVLRDNGIGKHCTATGPPALTGPPTRTIPEDWGVDGEGKGKGRKRKKLRAAATADGRPVALPALAPRRVRIDILPCDDSTGAYTSTPVSSWTITPTRQDQAGRGSDHVTAMAATSRSGSDGSGGNSGSTGNAGLTGSSGVASIEAAFADAVVRRCAVPEPVVIGYRPTEAMIRTVKARDGHCRFPGCTVAATFCDLDHVSPWREGATLTRVSNLICLCRRHHRTKQLRRWSVRMLPGAVIEWTDPTGRTRTTHPVNHLDPDPEPWLDPTGRPITDAHLNHTNATTDHTDGTDSTDSTASDGPSRRVELPSLLEETLEYTIDRFYADTGTPAERLAEGPTPRARRAHRCDFHPNGIQLTAQVHGALRHAPDTRTSTRAQRRPDDYPPPPF